ncbi:MAG: Crp/Fnr family transcriptional regulator [Pyrinomonadaceae bacterium]
MTEPTGYPIKNQLLSALPAKAYERLLPHLQPIEMSSGRVLFELGDEIKHIYFPLNSLISLVLEMSDGVTIEVGVVGNDGAAGLTAMLGQSRAINRAIVQIPNGGVQIKTAILQEEFDRAEDLQMLMHRYTVSLLTQVSQTAACNNHHRVEERLARWLLMCHDRVGSDEFNLTQEFIANMIGAHRPTVSTAASALQNEGLIKYSRGLITVLNRRGLESFACECYQAQRTMPLA